MPVSGAACSIRRREMPQGGEKKRDRDTSATRTQTCSWTLAFGFLFFLFFKRRVSFGTGTRVSFKEKPVALMSAMHACAAGERRAGLDAARASRDPGRISVLLWWGGSGRAVGRFSCMLHHVSRERSRRVCARLAPPCQHHDADIARRAVWQRAVRHRNGTEASTSSSGRRDSTTMGCDGGGRGAAGAAVVPGACVACGACGSCRQARRRWPDAAVERRRG